MGKEILLSLRSRSNQKSDVHGIQIHIAAQGKSSKSSKECSGLFTERQERLPAGTGEGFTRETA